MSLSSSQFGYPRALYDPHYIPPKLLHRTKELNYLSNLFHSSLNPDDQFDLNVYLYGIQGVGKTVLTLYFLNLLKSNIEQNFKTLYLDLTIKSPSENLRLLVELYSQSCSNKFIYLKNSNELWSYFQYLRNKIDIPLLIILDNMDYLNQRLYRKIIRYSKALKLSTIALSQIPFPICKKKFNWISDQFNPFKLEIYSSSALLDILSQRINLAFPIQLDLSLSKYIVDIVTQFDHFRPSTCISVLKTIYQHVISGEDISPVLIRDISVHLVEYPYLDDLSRILQFDDSIIELFYLPLLEKIAIYFQNGEKVYINQAELFRLYKITCDELYLPYNQKKFENFLEKLIFNGFLYPSQFNSNKVDNLFFMMIDPLRLREYLEIKFSKNSF